MENVGFQFDRRLTWVLHICYVMAASIKTLSLLRVLAHCSWGADQLTLLLLHKSLILTKQEYGCEIYFSSTDAHFQMLDSLHDAGVHLVIEAIGSPPIMSL